MFIDEKTVSRLIGRKITEATIDKDLLCLTIRFEDGPQLDIWTEKLIDPLKIELIFCP